jgi:hypothetical protein
MPQDAQEFRRDRRVSFETRAALNPVSSTSGSIEGASTIDLSESGARVRLSGQIKPGQVVELYLSKRPEPCRVVWTAPGETTQELIAGLEFICPLPDPRRPKTPSSSKFDPIN